MHFFQFAALIGGIFSQLAFAQIQPQASENSQVAVQQIQETEWQNEPQAIKKIKATVTAYSSTYDQTDSTPFITASNKNVEDGFVACNFLPFGTKVRFPEIYGDKTFTVEDRMSRRFDSHEDAHMDIWFSSRAGAVEFGVKSLEAEIVQQ